LSGQFLQGSLVAAVDTILAATITSHTYRNVMVQPKYGQIMNCGLTILIVSVFPVRLTNYDTDYCRYDTVDKMASIFTKHTWQPYMQCNKFI